MWKEISLEECKKRKEFYGFPAVFYILTTICTLGYFFLGMLFIIHIMNSSAILGFGSVVLLFICVFTFYICYLFIFDGLIRKSKDFTKKFLGTAITLLVLNFTGGILSLFASDMNHDYVLGAMLTLVLFSIISSIMLLLYTQYSKTYRLQFLHQVREIDL